MKIRTHKKHIVNSTVNFPNIGHKEVVDGIVDVPDDIAKLLTQGEDWEYADKSIVSKEKKSTKKVEEVLEEEDEDDEEQNLDSLSLPDLIEVAKEAKVKGWEKFKDKKAVLLALIKKTIKA